MAYDKTDWNVGDVINEALIDKIETGIEEAHAALGVVAGIHIGRFPTSGGGMLISPGSGWGILPGAGGSASIVHPLGHANYVVHLTPYGDSDVIPCYYSPNSADFTVRCRDANGTDVDAVLDFILVEYGT